MPLFYQQLAAVSTHEFAASIPAQVIRPRAELLRASLK